MAAYLQLDRGLGMRIVALVPAQNEEATVAQTVASLQDQSRPPDHIVVIADNCTDDTVRRAEQAGAEVLHTVDNTHRKAGALNQALERYQGRSEEHTSELQSRGHLVCRLLLEKKKNKAQNN